MIRALKILEENLEKEVPMLKLCPEWIKEAKNKENNFGVESYTEDYEEEKLLVADLKTAIKILKKYKTKPLNHE